MMKKIDKRTLKKAANNLLFDLTDGQYDVLLKEFEILLKQMEAISRIPHLDEARPMVFPFEVHTDSMREDVPVAPLKETEALSNAPHAIDHQIKVPKVI